MSGRKLAGEKPSGWTVDLSLIAVALIWGATFILVKQALAGVSTLLFLGGWQPLFPAPWSQVHVGFEDGFHHRSLHPASAAIQQPDL